MQGYFVQNDSEKDKKVPTGRLYIVVKNLPEFQELLDQAKNEADQLQRTINQLNSFELKIDFSSGGMNDS